MKSAETPFIEPEDAHLNPTDRQPEAEDRMEDIRPLSLRVNPQLVWDYDVPGEGQQSEAFRRWYVARVLTRGRAEDIRELGLRTIYAYLPHIALPSRISRFWEWYFGFPDVRERYGIADPPAA